MLVASKVKMSSSEKKRTGTQATKLLVYTYMYNISFIRCVTREFHVVAVQNNVKKMYEKSVLLNRPFDFFFAVLVAVAV